MSTPSTINAASPDENAIHADRMDRMYCYTRHVYDLTRRYYLFGRDRLLRKMVVPPNAAVLEMGCGTARNLLKFRKLHPDAELYGLDASRSMLVTAEENLNSHGIKDRVTLRHCLAEELDHEKTFERSEGFDVIFFSYSLSMMPTWHAALDVALANLRPQGRVYIVDFWDQSGLPKFFAIVLRKWLAAFHVHFRPELLERLRQLQEQKVCTLELSGLGGNYAYIAELAKRQDLAL